MVNRYPTREAGRDDPYLDTDLNTGAINAVETALEHALTSMGACSENYSDLEAALNCALTIARRRAREQRALDIIRDAHKQMSPILTATEVVVSAYLKVKQIKQ